MFSWCSIITLFEVTKCCLNLCTKIMTKQQNITNKEQKSGPKHKELLVFLRWFKGCYRFGSSDMIRLRDTDSKVHVSLSNKPQDMWLRLHCGSSGSLSMASDGICDFHVSFAWIVIRTVYQSSTFAINLLFMYTKTLCVCVCSEIWCCQTQGSTH